MIHPQEVLLCGNPNSAVMITREVCQLFEVNFKYQGATGVVAQENLLHSHPEVSGGWVNSKVLDIGMCTEINDLAKVTCVIESGNCLLRADPEAGCTGIPRESLHRLGEGMDAQPLSLRT